MLVKMLNLSLMTSVPAGTAVAKSVRLTSNDTQYNIYCDEMILKI